ncbi:MAG: nucleoside triphosphate pyrophosphohydrolase [Anaerolineales bacterium]|nr:nucleoside triphosphate pyrophosphohydrolase [Anaerolineales bacterium]
MPGITLLGLGPGNPDQLTRGAWDILSSADEIWLRTRQHPTVNALPSTVSLHSFDELYENGETFDQVYDSIVEKVLELGRRPGGVIYAVPGHPFVAETTCPKIARLARDEGLATVVVEGISFLEPTFSALGLDPYPRLTLFDAMELSTAHVPAFPPDMPVLIAQLYSRLVASEVKMTLNTAYSDGHPVWLVHAAGTRDELVEELKLYEIDRSEHIGLLTSLYVPPLGEGASFEAFQEIVAHLRAPDGCPWDREQTHASLRTHLLEEAYEALEAIDAGDVGGMQEEFGDLLLQIVLHAQIANEEGEFTINSLIKSIHDKIVRRHPHVFGDLALDGVNGVLRNWEKLKEAERKDNGKKKKGLLDGVPLALPALTQAQEYQDRAARVGFDWPVVDGVLDKVAEEIQEIRSATNEAELAEEIGDLFFALVNLARWKKIDAESALRETNLKFKRRFAFVEQGARQQGRALSDMTLEEMDALWESAKGLE